MPEDVSLCVVITEECVVLHFPILQNSWFIFVWAGTTRPERLQFPLAEMMILTSQR